jgi:predicted dehydrogenase
MADTLRIGMIGYAFMGRAHSQAWRTVNAFFDVPLRPEMVAICGRDAAAVQRAAGRLGWREAVTDWRSLVERDDIDLVDICSPGSNHIEPALAALAAGKHVLCEKPLANTVAEAERMAAAARAARGHGVRAMVGFNYRRVPALELARRLVQDGRLGRIHHVRAVYLQDWIVDPEFPLVWRLRREEAGSGSLGDIGSHIVDITQHILGERIATVSGLTETFVRERPLPAAASGLAGVAGRERGPVTVDDAALFLARFTGGAVATFEATRFAPGRRNGMRVEVNGSRGSVAFNMERLNELELYDAADPAGTQGFRTILVTEADHPWAGAWWPPGHILGWEHTFTHEVHDLIQDIAEGRDPSPGFDDGLQVQRVLDAVERSAARGTWEDVE